VTVDPVTVQDVPEPSALLLAGWAVPLGGFAFWRRLRRSGKDG
jgi:hypothetical protein